MSRECGFYTAMLSSNNKSRRIKRLDNEVDNEANNILDTSNTTSLPVLNTTSTTLNNNQHRQLQKNITFMHSTPYAFNKNYSSIIYYIFF